MTPEAIDLFAKGFVERREAQYDAFLATAKVRHRILSKKMREVCGVVFMAGWTDGYRDGRDRAAVTLEERRQVLTALAGHGLTSNELEQVTDSICSIFSPKADAPLEQRWPQQETEQ